MKRKPATKSAAIPAPAKAEPPPPYQPATAHERAAVERIRDRWARQTPAPRFKVKYEGNTIQLTADHDDPTYGHLLLADMMATADTVFAGGLLDQIANVARSGTQLTTRELNVALSTVRAIDPRDPTEALLAVQMAAIHSATIVAARRLNHSETITQQDSASNMLNKLTRTFAAQVEALKRYRSTGEQSIRVQHVNVSANQAVVGINQGGGGTHEKSSQSHAPSETSQSGPALLGHEQAVPMPLPGTGGEGPVGVPHARGTGRGAKGQG